MAVAARARPRVTARRSRLRLRRDSIVGLAFVAPALLWYAFFVLQPFALTIQYSFFRWDGIGPATWVGLSNYEFVLGDAKLLGAIFNALRLVLFFSIIPVTLGLIVSSVMRRVAQGRFGSVARTALFLPQVIPLIAAGIVWRWMLSLTGTVNQGLTAVGLGEFSRVWLGDFDTALGAVGFIGVWVLTGFCTVLLQTGMSKIDIALYESARLDGAGWFQELRAITLPSLRYEIGVCLTVTTIAALAAFDIVYVATAGGPGNATMVPGLQIYVLAFQQRALGLASALAVVLMLLVLAVVLVIQRITRGSSK